MFNPGAGGSSRYVSIREVIDSVFADHELITGSSFFCSSYTPGEELAADSFQAKLADTLASFVDAGVDMIIGVGGDGFLTHIACFLIRQKVHIPLMGVAGGTANIGPLIQFDQDTLRGFAFKDMVLEKVGCIEVTTGGCVSGYAFCDVILGDTFLGTKNGQMCNFSAKAFLRSGDKIEAVPREHITGDQFSLLKNGSRQVIKSRKIAQIIASPLYHKEYYRGKAITGALCYSPYLDCGASIGISDSIIVDSRSSMDETIVIEHLLFGKDDIISIEGIDDDTYVIIDGNVYEIKDRAIELRYIEDGARSVTMKAYNGLPKSNT